MKKLARVITLMMLSLFAVSVVLSSVYADPVEKADAFVCPHLGGKAGENPHSPWQAADGEHPQAEKFNPIYGGYTVGGPDVSVPAHATNWGFPNIEHGVPGDVGYTAIWNRANAP